MLFYCSKPEDFLNLKTKSSGCIQKICKQSMKNTYSVVLFKTSNFIKKKDCFLMYLILKKILDAFEDVSLARDKTRFEN